MIADLKLTAYVKTIDVLRTVLLGLGVLPLRWPGFLQSREAVLLPS